MPGLSRFLFAFVLTSQLSLQTIYFKIKYFELEVNFKPS